MRSSRCARCGASARSNSRCGSRTTRRSTSKEIRFRNRRGLGEVLYRRRRRLQNDQTLLIRRLLVALDVVGFVLVPVMVRRGLALRRREIGPDAGGVRSVSFPDLVFDRARNLDRPLNMIGIDELRLLCDGNVACGSDETTEFPEAEAQGLVFVVQRLRAPPPFLDHDADRVASRRRDALVHRDLLSYELGQFRAVRVRVRHRGLDEDLVPAPGDTGAQRRQDVRKVLDVARADEDEVARDALDLDARPRALRIPTRDREPLLLHRGQDEPLKVAEQRQLVDEQDALMRFVDCARDAPIVRLRAELWMAAVWIVADVSEEFGLARSGRQDERPSRDRDEDLSRALLLDLATLL